MDSTKSNFHCFFKGGVNKMHVACAATIVSLNLLKYIVPRKLTSFLIYLLISYGFLILIKRTVFVSEIHKCAVALLYCLP